MNAQRSADNISALTDVSRRTFLGTVAGGVFALAQTSDAELAIAQRISFALVSDTHLGYRDGTTARDQWAKVADELQQSDVDFVLHLGDIVDGGRVGEYPIYMRIRDSIGKPVYEIPGNHDHLPHFKRYISGESDRTVDRGSFRFVLMNNARYGEHDGFLTAEQCAWLERQCHSAVQDGRSIFVCMHVPVHYNVHPDRGWYVKPEHGQAQFYEIINRYQDRVIGILHGHFHNGIRGWSDRVPEIAFPSVLYNQDRNLESQGAPGYNLDEFRPGYSLVTVIANEMAVRYKPTGDSWSAEKRYSADDIRSEI